MNTQPIPTIVLVHGGFVDGSGWQGVYNLLKADGYQVRIVQNPTLRDRLLWRLRSAFINWLQPA